MRSLALLMAVIGFAAIPLSAGAVPAGSDKVATLSARHIITVDARCGPGQHWVPEGYAKHAKWRPGHCAAD